MARFSYQLSLQTLQTKTIMFRFNKLTENVAKLTFDSYNKQQSELTFAEAKLIKPNDNFITIYGVITADDYSFIGKLQKTPDNKWQYDPSFKFDADTFNAVRLDIPLQTYASDNGKEIKASKEEMYIASRLLEDIGDGGMFEGSFDLGCGSEIIFKINELKAGGTGANVDKAVARKEKAFYNIVKIDACGFITDELIATANNAQSDTKTNSKGGKNYPSEGDKLLARAEFAKRFLADDWDKSKDYSTITFDECLDTLNKRVEINGIDKAEIMHILTLILS